VGAQLEFRILGPLEVRRDGVVVEVGGPRQRALLALLLCSANRVISRDRLIEELLGDRPARSLEGMLRVQVSRLRKALADGEDEPRLIARPPGYVLRVEAGELDLERFERVYRDGRAALEAEDPSRAAVLLREAEGLWRGRPLADLEFEPFARFEVQRIEELRLLAVEDRIEADLALGRHADLCAELGMLTSEYPLRERLRGELMLALYRSGRQADALAVYRQTSELLREELGLDPSRTLRELERSILEQDASLEPSRRAAVATRAELSIVCPFRGLDFFDRADAEYFFGREPLVAELLTRAAESGLVGILGPSGIGKSSLLRAGVLAALGRDGLPGSASWRQVLLRPGERPHTQLTRALGGKQIDTVLAGLPPGERLVIAVDQLEELFTSCESDDERGAFLEQLCAAAADVRQRALLVVALRGDFYVRFVAFPKFAALLSRRHVLVGPMDRAELADAIEQPAARVGLEIERPLVDALVSDAVGRSGGLPLLSAMLVQLWQARDGHTLRYQSYQASGGMQAAVARLAEAAYVGLDTPQQQVARTVLMRLASEQNGALVRRRAPVAELDRIEGANPVVAALIDARLLTLSDGRIELSHEALLHEWPRYRSWLDEDQAGRRVRAHLTATAAEWEAHGREPSELYRGTRLAAALDWDALHVDRLNSLEREFLDCSRLEAERETRRQRAQNRRLRGLLLGVGALLIIAVVAGAIALIKQRTASNEARAALARQLGAEAVNEPRLDLAMLLAREAVKLDRSQQTEGTLLATLQRSPSVIGTLALPVTLAPQLAVSPDGRTLTVSHSLINHYGFQIDASLGTVSFYDARTHAPLRPPLTDFFGAGPPVYSSDGSLLAYATADTPPSIVVRDAHTRARLATLRFDPFQIARLTPDIAHASILISPDGRTVYCAYRVFDLEHTEFRARAEATYLARWSLPSAKLLSTTRIDPGAVLALRLSAAGRRLLVVDARRVNVFDASSLRRQASVAIAPAPVAPTAAAISPDGRVVALGSQAGQVSFVDASTGRARAGAGAHGGAVTGVTYAPDGGAVVTVGSDNRVVVWNPTTARAATVLTAPAEQVQAVAFSPDSSTLYTSSPGGVLLEWDLSGGRTFGRRFALEPASPAGGAISPPAPPLALSPDGATFAVRLGTSTIGLFSARTLRQEASFTIAPTGAAITALAWSPTASELAVGGYSGLVQLWEVDGTPRLLRSLAGLHAGGGLPDAIQALAFSPDGRLVAGTDSSETLQSPGDELVHFDNRLLLLAAWRLDDGALLRPPLDLGTGLARYAGALAFSPTGRLLAVSTPDSAGDVPNPIDVIVDPTTFHVRQSLRPLGDDDTVSLAFASNGVLATGTAGGIVQLWNPTSGKQVAGPVAVAAGPVTSVTFDASGERLATTGGQDGLVKLWFASTLEQEGTALNVDHGAVASAAFTPDGESLLAVDDHGNAFAWPTSLAAWEQRACAIAGRNLTPQEWRRILSGRNYAKVCP
jgi:DNA-binding SARP family transcriptional activator/WD40 repeat protein